MSAATTDTPALDAAKATDDELLAYLEQDGASNEVGHDVYVELMRRLERPAPPELEVLDAPHPKLIAALAAAQGEFPSIEKTKTATVYGEKNGQRYEYSYGYADLGDVLAKVRPVLSRHGLALVQRTERVDGAGAKVLLVTELHHTAGGLIESVVELGQSSSSPQQFGGALTYLRRYEAVTLLGIAAEEDRDAQDVEPPRNGQAPAPAVLPSWATALNQEKARDLFNQLEVLVGAEHARGLMGEIKQRTEIGIPALFLPFAKAIAERQLETSSEELEEQRDHARAVAAGDAEPTPAPVDPADSDVPPDMEGLPSGGGLFDDADSPVFEPDENEGGETDGD